MTFNRISAGPKPTTTYVQQSPTEDSGAWECSTCTLLWILDDGAAPSEHNMHYCPQCGLRIKEEVPWAD